MFITFHAAQRLQVRLGDAFSDTITAMLEAWEGERGTVAYIVMDLPRHTLADDGSNGDVLVVVAVEGSVETVYFRRSSQDMSAQFFGASRVVDTRKVAHTAEGA